MILSFDEPGATQLATSGGKGASLARLLQGGFKVPPGIIIAASAYSGVIEQNDEMRARIDSLDFSSADTLIVQCAELRRLIMKLSLPTELETELRKRVAHLVHRGPVAVRSSSTMEDLAGAAFAGQHDTFLGVRTIDDVVEKVLRCFASLWEDRAAHYRHMRGFDQQHATMAVVIQLLIESEVAGVTFTMNPISGNLGEILVNASYGLC